MVSPVTWMPLLHIPGIFSNLQLLLAHSLWLKTSKHLACLLKKKPLWQVVWWLGVASISMHANSSAVKLGTSRVDPRCSSLCQYEWLANRLQIHSGQVKQSCRASTGKTKQLWRKQSEEDSKSLIAGWTQVKTVNQQQTFVEGWTQVEKGQTAGVFYNVKRLLASSPDNCQRC